MIAILSSKAAERAVVRSLFETQQWPCFECTTVRELMRYLARVTPRVVVMRQKLSDGFSDGVIPRVTAAAGGTTRMIVLADAALTPTLEARQLAIGADAVLRDPVRTEVLIAYVAKYLATSTALPPPRTDRLKFFCDAKLDSTDWSVTRNQRSIRISPREMALAELLSESEGRVVSYERLYSTILDRRFGGDSSNMRVLLALLQTSMKGLGIRLRDYVAVIPKSGYRYTHPSPATRPAEHRRRTTTRSE